MNGELSQQNSDLQSTIVQLRAEAEKLREECKQIEQLKDTKNQVSGQSLLRQNSFLQDQSFQEKKSRLGSLTNTNIELEQISSHESQALHFDSSVGENCQVLKLKLAKNLSKQEKFVAKFITQKLTKARSKLEHQFYEKLSQSLQQVKSVNLEMAEELMKLSKQFDEKTQEQQSTMILTLQSVKVLKQTTEKAMKELEEQLFRKSQQNIELQQQQSDMQLTVQSQLCEIQKLQGLFQKQDRVSGESAASIKELRLKLEKSEQEKSSLLLKSKDAEFKIKQLEDQVVNQQVEVAKLCKELEDASLSQK